MVTVTEHVAVFDIDGSETVVFKRAHEVYGIYGSDIIATLIPNAQEGDQGVYSTSEMGKVTIAHYSDKKELYLKGSGTVLVWCGASPLDDPFWGGASEGSGGGGGDTPTGLGALAYKNSASGDYTPRGNVDVTSTTDTVSEVSSVGTLPTWTYNGTTENLTFSAGTLPMLGTAKTVVTGASASFTGTRGTVTVS